MRISRSRLAVVLISSGLLLLPILFRIPNPYGNQVMQEVHETSHTVLFFFAQLALMLTVQKRRPDWPLAYVMLGTGFACVCLGGMIELIQPYFQRSRSWIDLGRDVWGILAASGLYYGWQLPRRAPLVRSAAIAVSVLAILIAFTPIADALYRQWVRDRTFPVLIDFDNKTMRQSVGRAEYGRLRFVRAPAEWSDNESLTAEVIMPKATRWSGFALYQPTPDWGDFKRLSFEVFSPSEKPVRIAMNIYSIESKNKVLRYQAFEVQHGLNEFSVNLTDEPPVRGHYISRMLWYSIAPERDVTLYFDNIRLLKD